MGIEVLDNAYVVNVETNRVAHVECASGGKGEQLGPSVAANRDKRSYADKVFMPQEKKHVLIFL